MDEVFSEVGDEKGCFRKCDVTGAVGNVGIEEAVDVIGRRT